MAVELRALRAQDQALAAGLVAAAMEDGPIHIAVHGERDRRAALEAGFSALLQAGGRGGTGAWDGAALCGVAVFGEPGSCPLTSARRAALGRLVGPHERFWAWRDGWAQHDPVEPHWHLGPFAVAPERQGEKIGTQLLEAFLAQVGEDVAYLEADSERNVAFYQGFGFSVAATAEVLGVPCWFMRR